MDPKLIVLDIDGTLVGEEDQITPRTLDALRRARRHGAIIALATGRRLDSVLPIARTLEISVPLICMNGALVVDSETLSVLSVTTLEPGPARRAVEAVHSSGQTAFVYHPSPTPPNVYYQLSPSHPAVDGYIAREKRYLRRVDDLLAHCDEIIRVLTFGSGPDVDSAHAACVDALKEYETWILKSPFRDVFTLEVYPLGISKGRALRRLARDLGIPLSHVMAFGDGPNDLDLLEVAGMGVAMGNGIPEAKRMADMITKNQEEDGVAHVLEGIFPGT